MNPRMPGPRFAPFVHTARMWGLGVISTLALLQGCSAGGSTPTSSSTNGSTSGDAGAGGSGQTGGMGGSAGSSTSSSASGSSSSGMGGSGAGFMPPMGTADYPAETESNDVATLANPFVLTTKGFTGSVFPIGDIDVFVVDITTSGTNLAVKISDGMGGCPAGLSATLRVDGPNGLVGGDNGTCPKLAAPLTPGMANLPVGKHYVQVESASLSVDPFYVVEISLEPPKCGNGILQGVEQCDDGNTNVGDGCTAACKLEGNIISESEPNQPATSANSLNGVEGVFASIMPVGDQDFFSFDIATAGSSVTLEVSDGLGGCPAGFDSILSLFSPSDMLLVTADDGAVASCSKISPMVYPLAMNLPVGKYTARVEKFGNASTQDSYVLKITVQ